MKGLLFFIRKQMVLMVLGIFLITSGPPGWADTIPGFNQISTNPYIVDDLPISIDSDNAVHAREQAFERALQTGFTIILERLYPNTEIRAGINTPPTPELGRMLQDFSTRDEKVGPKQYAATFQLRFRAGRVQKYLQSTGTTVKPAIPIDTANTPETMQPQINNSGSTPPPLVAVVPTAPVMKAPVPTSAPAPLSTAPSRVLVLPFFQTAQGQILWAGSNPLRDALAATAQTPTTLAVHPLGDPDDRQILNETYGIRANPASLQTLMAKYQTDRMLMIVAVPDTLNPTTNATKMTLMFYGSSMVNPTPSYLDSVVASIPDPTDAPNSADTSALFARAAENIQSQIPTLTSRINMEVPEQDILGTDPITSTTLTVSSASLPSTVSPVLTDTAPLIDNVLNNTRQPIDTLAPSSFTSAAQNPIPPLSITENGLPMIVRFNTMTEWNDIRTRIKSIPGVSTIRITKLKAQEATIDIVTSPEIAVNPTTLQAALNARGLELHADTSNMSGASAPLILTRGTVPSAAAAPVQPHSESSYDFNTSSRPINESRGTIDDQ